MCVCVCVCVCVRACVRARARAGVCVGKGDGCVRGNECDVLIWLIVGVVNGYSVRECVCICEYKGTFGCGSYVGGWNSVFFVCLFVLSYFMKSMILSSI